MLHPDENAQDSGMPHGLDEITAAWADTYLAYVAALARSDAWMRAYAVIKAYRPGDPNNGWIWGMEQVVL